MADINVCWQQVTKLSALPIHLFISLQDMNWNPEVNFYHTCLTQSEYYPPAVWKTLISCNAPMAQIPQINRCEDWEQRNKNTVNAVLLPFFSQPCHFSRFWFFLMQQKLLSLWIYRKKFEVFTLFTTCTTFVLLHSLTPNCRFLSLPHKKGWGAWGWMGGVLQEHKERGGGGCSNMWYYHAALVSFPFLFCNNQDTADL